MMIVGTLRKVLISSTRDDYGANKRNESIIAMVKSTIKGSLNKKLKE